MAVHEPVLVREVVEALAPREGDLLVDATVGLGGHATALLQAAPGSRLVGFDLDPSALALAGTALAPFGDRVRLVNASYREMAPHLAELGIDAVDGIVFDLGVSSLQLDTPERGFSFRYDGPLDMRFGSGGPTAADLLAGASEEELMQILREYGEEPRARRVARAIVRARETRPITRTGDLRAIVLAALGRGRGRIDPSTRTFQALRIATNRELDGLSDSLENASHLLRPTRRIAVIAFHSLEDRIVKRTFRHLSGRCVCPPGTGRCTCDPQELLEVVTRRPLWPAEEEVERNPRARSARIRVAERRAG